MTKGEAPNESKKSGTMEVSRALLVEPETAMAISRDWLLRRDAWEGDSSSVVVSPAVSGIVHKNGARVNMGK